MAERQLTALMVAHDGSAVGFVADDGSTLTFAAVAEDLRCGRQEYLVVVEQSRSVVRLVDGAGPYAGLYAVAETVPDNLIDRLPQHRHELWHQLDEAVPLRPEPVKPASWKRAYRRAVVGVLSIIAVCAVLLVRPVGWDAIGGEQSVAGVVILPRMDIVFVSVAMTITAAVLTRLLAASRGWTRLLGIAGVTLLAVEAGARTAIDAAASLGRNAASPAAVSAMRDLRACGLFAELAAVVGGILAARAKSNRRARPWLAPALIGLAFLLPLVAFVWSLALPREITQQLTENDPLIGVDSSLNSTLASAIFEPYAGLIYMGLALAAWQAVTFVQAITEATQQLGQMIERRIMKDQRRPKASLNMPSPEDLLVAATTASKSWRAPVWTVGVLLVAAAKFAFDVAGYAHVLPSGLGGSAELWYQADDGWASWLFMAVIAVPAAWHLLRRIRAEDARASLGPPLIWLSAAVALLGPVQVVAQTVSDFLPGAQINPPTGSPFFVPLSVIDWASIVLIAIGTVYYWNRQTAAAALFGLALVIALPGRLQGLFGVEWPIAGLGRWDLVISAVMFGWCALYLVRRAQAPAPWLIATWLGLSVLVHFQTLVPDDQQSTYFVYLALLPAAYALLWGGRRINELAEKRPEQALIALCVMAMLLVIVAVLVWVNDRFGRADNSFINGASIFSEGGRQQIGVPLLMVTTWGLFMTKRPPRSSAHASTSS